ncbi:MAG TPA: IS630 family transposase [Chloroflexota bacterium]|jgi:transposase
MNSQCRSIRPAIQEWQRLRAWALHQDGWTGRAIARALSVTPGAVSRWLKRARAEGSDALRRRTAPGPCPRLSPEQQAQLTDLLAQRAEAFGFLGAVWTTKRVAWLIASEFGVRYHPAHVSRLLRAVGLSVQKPLRRATQRDDAAITAWEQEGRPALEQQAREAGATVVWVDESGFYLLPGCVRTYAPRGHTPVLRVRLTRDHLSAIGALTATGQLLLQVYEHALRGPQVVRFLRHLLRHVPGKLLVLWDGSPIHRAQVVRDFLAQGVTARLHLVAIPAYAPEQNPQEGVWRHLKYVELRNVCCHDVFELRQELRLAVARLRHKRTVLGGCARQCGYGVRAQSCALRPPSPSASS